MHASNGIATILSWLWQTTWQAALLACAVAGVSLLLRRRLSPQARQMLWLLVFVRLVMPALPASPLSIFTLLDRSTPVPVAPPTERIEFRLGKTIAAAPVKIIQMSQPIPSIDWTSMTVASLWMLGVCTILVRVWWANRRFAHEIAAHASLPEQRIADLVANCCAEAGMRPIAIRMTDRVSSPALFGAVHPVLLLPLDIPERLDRQTLRAIVLHELEHRKRRHLLADLVLTCLCAVHWFNPFIWWAQRQVRATRELICDQAVLARIDRAGAIRYGEAMLDLASTPSGPHFRPALAAFVSRRPLLCQRIEAIVEKPRSIRGLGMTLAPLLAVGCLTKPKPHETVKPATNPIVSIVPPTTTAPTRVRRADPSSPENAAVYAQLERVFPEVRFDGVPLEDVVGFLRDFSGANIVVNWEALQKAGIERKKTTVSARFRDVKFAKALEMVLHDVGGGAARLGYIVDQGMITISTEDDLRGEMVLSTYDIRPLISASDPTTKKQLTDRIIKLIQDSAGWDANCTMQEQGGQLAVTAPLDTHEQIRRIVAQLGEARSVQVLMQGIVLEVPKAVAAQMPEQNTIDDAGVERLLTMQGVNVIQRPRVLSPNGEEAVVEIASNDHSHDFRLALLSTIERDRRSIVLKTDMTLKRPQEIWRLKAMLLTAPEGATIVLRQLEMRRLNADGSESALSRADRAAVEKQVWLLLRPTIIARQSTPAPQDQFPAFNPVPQP